MKKCLKNKYILWLSLALSAVLVFSGCLEPSSFDDDWQDDLGVSDFHEDTLVKWSFETDLASGFELTYSYHGLKIQGGKLTTNTIEGSKTISIKNNIREYTITSRDLAQNAPNDLIAISNIVVKAEVNGVKIELETEYKAMPIELLLYNIAYEKAKEYGAIEMFSHGRAAATASVNVQARGHTIVNFDSRGNPVNFYSATLSRGYGGILGIGTGDATHLREWYYDGFYLYGRSNGGATNVIEGSITNETAPVLPSATASRWANINSVNSGHTGKWTAFVNAFKQNPFNYMPYDINTAYISLYEYQYLDPSKTTNAADSNNSPNAATSRSSSPSGLIQTNTRGALAHNNGNFEFTILMNGNATGNNTNIEWSGNVTISNMNHSSITFVIDEDMKFVKYHAMERYTVTLLSATTNTAATMYFVYHKNPINLYGYATFRPHQTRLDHVNNCACSSCESVIAPNGNIATGNMVVANSKYEITLDWTENANEASKVSIP